MKLKKKLFVSMFMVLVILTLTCSPVLSADIQAAYAKIPDSLLEEFSAVGNNGTLNVVVWLEDEATDKYQSIVENIPEPSFGNDSDSPESYSIQSISETADELSEEERLAQIEEVQNYIMQKRQIAQAVYLEDNTQIANELAESGGEVVYISRYSPLVICDVTLSEAVDMAMCDSVLGLESSIQGQEIDLSSTSFHTIGITELPTSSYDASGIKIGMIEYGGVPDMSETCFQNISHKITNVNNVSYLEIAPSNHASAVANLFVSVARNFEHLYCTRYENDTTFFINIEALLSYGVNVINMSAGSTLYNEYTLRAKWVDHIAYNHSVHFVMASGNSGEDGVLSPGMAHNAITVGNTNDFNTVSTDDDEIWEGNNPSSYNSNTNNVAFKPDICAPGTNILFNNSNWSGTSMSAPHVAGTVAILCSRKPILLEKQALMKSILMSSVSIGSGHRYDLQVGSDGCISENYKQYGSGIVNAYNALSVSTNETYRAGTITSSEEHDSISIGNLQKGDTVSITLTFLKRVRFETSNHSNPNNLTETSADLDLYICAAATYIGGSCSPSSGLPSKRGPGLGSFSRADRGIGGVRHVAPPTWLVSNFLVRPASS